MDIKLFMYFMGQRGVIDAELQIIDSTPSEAPLCHNPNPSAQLN